MFALSFALLYLLKDYNIESGMGQDVNFYITSFQTINDVAWSEIFYRFTTSPNGNEFLYWIYIKIAHILLFGNAVFFTFFHYFLTFVLIAYIGKIIDTNKFVIIIGCLLLLNYQVISIIPLFRQISALLLFFTGIFLFDAREKSWLPRIFIYSSFFFHISLAPMIIFFELFALVCKRGYIFDASKLYSKAMVGYMAIPVLALIFFNNNFLYSYIIPAASSFDFSLVYYFEELHPERPYSGILFNWITYLILLSLWLRRKKLANTDVFNATQYFIFLVVINEIPVPDVFSRFIQYAIIGGTFIIGRMGAANIKLGFMLLMFMFINFYKQIHFNPGFNEALSHKMYSGYLDPFSGVGNMILYFDTIFNFNL